MPEDKPLINNILSNTTYSRRGKDFRKTGKNDADAMAG
jgi:hypothetical protein